MSIVKQETSVQNYQKSHKHTILSMIKSLTNVLKGRPISDGLESLPQRLKLFCPKPLAPSLKI